MATTNTPVVVDKKAIDRETVIAEANITKIFEIIKQEARYTNNTNNKISYTELLKGVIQEKVNKIPEIKESTESIKQNEENTEENIVKQEIITEKTAENIATELKKEDETVVIQKSERKYPEEVTKRSLGIGIKLK